MYRKKKYVVIVLLTLSFLTLNRNPGFCVETPSILMKQGLEKFQKGDYSGAVNDLKVLISVTKDNPYNYFYARITEEFIIFKLKTREKESEFRLPIEQLV